MDERKFSKIVDFGISRGKYHLLNPGVVSHTLCGSFYYEEDKKGNDGKKPICKSCIAVYERKMKRRKRNEF